jgi:ubiquitin-protein ligase
MDENDIYNWKMSIDGQNEFKGGTFIVNINMTAYPFKAPEIVFKTKCYHPNVAADGKICT